MNVTLWWVFLCIFLNTVAQIVIKEAMNRIGTLVFTWDGLLPTALKIATSPLIIFGIFCYVLSLAFWLIVLSKTEVSIAYPLISLGYITTAIAACYFLGENLPMIRIVGIFVIIIGVYFVAQS